MVNARRITRCVTMFFAAVAPAALAAQAPERVDVARVMSSDELTATGVGSLTVDQRRALEQWLARYTTLVATTARAISTAPSADTAAHAPRTTVRIRGSVLPEGGEIERVLDDGFLMLEDGSIWEVHLPDRPRSDSWHRGEFVSVQRLAASQGDFGYALVHGANSDRAAARFAGWARPGSR